MSNPRGENCTFESFIPNSWEQKNTKQEREPEPTEPQYYDEIEVDEIEGEDLERDQDRAHGRDRGGYER